MSISYCNNCPGCLRFKNRRQRDYFQVGRVHGNGYTTDCAGMRGKPMAAIGSRALELSTVRR
jgi:hypothetical protein